MKISSIGLLCLAILTNVALYCNLTFAKENVKVEFYIVFTGNTFGELKPCGCTQEEDQGGIERRQTFLKNIRNSGKEVILVDTGDSFKEPTRQGRIKAQFLMKGMDKMAYDSVAIGDKDLVYGNKFLSQFKSIPWLSSNMELQKTGGIPNYRIKTLNNGTRIAILALSEPKLFFLLHSPHGPYGG